MIVGFTNLHAEETEDVDFEPTDEVEMHAFIGLLLLVAVKSHHGLAVTNIWSTDPIIGVRKANETMSRNRFTDLIRHIRFGDRNERDREDRFAPIRRVFTLIDASCRRHYTAGPVLTVDESIIPFRGRCRFRQYLPAKSSKYGLKIFCLVEPATHYCISMIPYLGKGGDVPLPLGQNVVLQLVKKMREDEVVKSKHRHLIVTDNFFTSLALADNLKKHNCFLLGTIRSNAVGLPKDFVKESVTAGMSKVVFNSPLMLLKYQPKPKKSILMLSSGHHGYLEQEKVSRMGGRSFRKPAIIHAYNEGKAGVDMLDQMMKDHTCSFASRR